MTSRVLPFITLVMVMFIPTDGNPTQTKRVATGVWGGEHVVMHVGKASAALEYDCAAGAVAGPLVLNRKGEFVWRGTHSPEHGGPVRSDEQSVGQPVVYTGSVHGDTMTLMVKRKDTDEDLGTFTLKQGSQGNIFKCR